MAFKFSYYALTHTPEKSRLIALMSWFMAIVFIYYKTIINRKLIRINNWLSWSTSRDHNHKGQPLRLMGQVRDSNDSTTSETFHGFLKLIVNYIAKTIKQLESPEINSVDWFSWRAQQYAQPLFK